jgi:hypothetical protein
LTGTLTATSTQSFVFTVKVTDSSGDSATATLTIIDTVAAALGVVTGCLSTTANVNFTLQATGGSGGNTWAATGLPAGLTLAADGTLSGVLNGGTSTKSYTFQATVADSDGTSASKSISIDYQPTALTQSSANFTIGVANSITLAARSGGTYTYQVASSSVLPAGLTLSSAGVLSGTPNTSDVSTSVNIDIYLDGDLVGIAPLDISVASSAVPIDSAISFNWAGIADTGSSITHTTGSFVVPTLSSTQSSTCQSDNTSGMGQCTMAEWVGVDGFANGYLIQAGVNVTPTWSSSTSAMVESVVPWYEIITPTNAAPETPFPAPSVPMKAGDTISVSLARVATGSWTIVLTDTTNGESYTEANVPFTASATGGESADWIGETTEFVTGSTDQFSLLPNISSGGQFTSRSLAMGSLSASYAISRSCTSSGGVTCDTSSTDVTSPTGYGTVYNLQPFGFTW